MYDLFSPNSPHSLGLSITVEDILVSRCIWSRVRSFLTHYIVATLQLLSLFSCAVFAFYLNEYMLIDWKATYPDGSKVNAESSPVLMLILLLK